jgi:hypothetical protein
MATCKSTQRLNDLLCELEDCASDVSDALEFCRAGSSPRMIQIRDEEYFRRVSEMLIEQADAKHKRLRDVIDELAEISGWPDRDWDAYWKRHNLR